MAVLKRDIGREARRIGQTEKSNATVKAEVETIVLSSDDEDDVQVFFSCR